MKIQKIIQFRLQSLPLPEPILIISDRHVYHYLKKTTLLFFFRVLKMLLFNLQDLTILPENGLLVPIVKTNI
jgi:hypothetical protein